MKKYHVQKLQGPVTLFCLLIASATLTGCDQKDPAAEDSVDDPGAEAPTSETDTSETDTGSDTAPTASAPQETDSGASPTDPGTLPPAVNDGGVTPGPAPQDAGADAPDAQTEPDPELDYFPLVNGSVWTYRHTKVGEEVWTEVVTLTQATGNEAPGFKLVDEPNRDGEVTEQVWRWVGTAVMRISRRELVGGNVALLSTYDPGFPRFDTRWTTPGFSETVTYQRTEQEAGQSPATEQRSQVYEVLDTNASVSIDDTTYERCLLIARTRPDTGDVGHYWFAPGVGKVKELDPDSMTMEELIGYTTP